MRLAIYGVELFILPLPQSFCYSLGIITGGGLVDYLLWGLQYVLICFLHIWPCLVQRLNRAQLYAAIAEIRSESKENEKL
jgi:hypothetical protein